MAAAVVTEFVVLHQCGDVSILSEKKSPCQSLA
jgi:hypothetical protein